MHKQDLALNNLQGLICQKDTANQAKLNGLSCKGLTPRQHQSLYSKELRSCSFV